MKLIDTSRVGAVDVIQFARPEKLNALSSGLVDEFARALSEAGSSGATVLLLGGHGTSFCAGADMAELGTDAEAGRRFLEQISEALAMLRYFKKPVVAAIQGYAVGGGAEIALEADLRVMSTNAIIRFPDVAIGSTPASTFQLVRAVGPSIAARMVLLQEDLDAERANELGLCTKLVASDVLWDEALQVAERIAGLSPLSLRLAKQSLRVAWTSDGQTDLAVNLELMMQCFETRAQQSAIQEFFVGRI